MPTSSSAPSDVARIKGAALQDFYEWYAGQQGEARMTAIWQSLSPAARQEVGPSHKQLLPFRWYPAPVILELLTKTMDGHTDVERDELAREGARIVIDKTLRGLYKAIFAALVTPSRYIRNAHRVWGSFHDTGVAKGFEVGAGHHRLELSGWRAHHPFIERLNGYAGKVLYEAMGCRNVRFDQTQRMDPGGITYITNVFFEK